MATATPSKHESAPTQEGAKKETPDIQKVVDYVLESGVDVSTLLAELDRVRVAEDNMKQVIVADLKDEELLKDKEEFDKKVEEALKAARAEIRRKAEEDKKKAEDEEKKKVEEAKTASQNKSQSKA